MYRSLMTRLLALVAVASAACSPEATIGVAPLPDPLDSLPVEPSDAPEWVPRNLSKLARRFTVPAQADQLIRPDPPDLPYPRPCAPVYDEDRLVTYEVEIDPEDLRELQSEFASREFRYGSPTYFPIRFRYEGTVKDAHIKVRGHNSECRGKMQFAISFNQVNSSGRFQGMRRLNLDHGGCHMFEERLAMSFARDLGLPYSCANHARLIINGEYYGLFVNVEHQNKDYLKRHFARYDGNLYKEDDELKTNEKLNDTSDIDRYLRATSLSSLEKLVDLDEAISMWAFEAVILALDNYWLNGYNYMLYNHPDRGFLFLPNDLDQAMPSRPGGLDGIWPSSLQFPANIVLADETWRQRYEEKVREIARAYDSREFSRRLDAWWLQVREAALEDPFISDEIEARLERLKAGLRLRDDSLDRWR